MQILELALDDIHFNDDNRQRQKLGDIKDLIASIQRNGLIHPVTVDENNRLLAGRRRLEAYRRMGRRTIPAVRKEDLDPVDQKLVELDENIRRQDLTWQEKSLAIYEIYELRGCSKGQGEINAIAERVGLDQSSVSRYVNVGKALRAGDKSIAECKGINQAAEQLTRRQNLEFRTFISQIGENDDDFATDELGPSQAPTPKAEIEKPPAYQIIQGDFLQFAPSYSGPRFNFVHCDFPYGIGIDKSDAAGSAAHESQYEDSEQTFWALTEALLDNRDRLLLDSAHVMFWFSMKYYERLVAKLEAHGFFVHELPLVWHKSDGMGIASDYRRRPKHVYETALWCSLGDRMIIKVKDDVYPAPIARATEGHVSAKPKEMLRHFLSMGVNDLTRFLDPTCGSGTSVRTAAELGAETALGIELNPDTAQSAALKLKSVTND